MEVLAQFDFKNLDTGKLAHIIQNVGKHTDHVVAVLEKPGTQKALVEAFAEVRPKAVVKASAKTIKAAKAEGPGVWIAPPSPSADAGATATAASPLASPANHAEAGVPAPQGAIPEQHQHLEDALESFGRTIDKGAQLLDGKRGNLKKEVDKALPRILEKDVPNALTGFLKNENLKKDLEATLNRETPKFAERLKDINPKQVEELLKHTDKDINEVMRLYKQYKWWSQNWHRVLGTVLLACMSLVLLSTTIQRLCCRRARKHGPTVEFNMWVGTGPQRRGASAENMESGFQQF